MKACLFFTKNGGFFLSMLEKMNISFHRMKSNRKVIKEHVREREEGGDILVKLKNFDQVSVSAS